MHKFLSFKLSLLCNFDGRMILVATIDVKK